MHINIYNDKQDEEKIKINDDESKIRLYLKTISDPILIIVGTFILHQTVFWIANGIILLITYVLYPQQSRKFKIQKEIHVDANGLKECVKTVLINQVFVLLPLLIAVCPIFLHFNLRWHLPFPAWYQILFELVAFVGVTEIFFYYSHMMLHWPSIYAPIHKKHHRFRAPIGMACEYAHPIEFVISNVGPVMAGPFIFRSHLLTVWLWLVIALLGTIQHHSGYRLPGILGHGLSDPSFHDFHHAEFTNNFGLLGFLDRLHGTDKAWQDKKNREKQHIQ